MEKRHRAAILKGALGFRISEQEKGFLFDVLKERGPFESRRKTVACLFCICSVANLELGIPAHELEDLKDSRVVRKND